MMNLFLALNLTLILNGTVVMADSGSSLQVDKTVRASQENSVISPRCRDRFVPPTTWDELKKVQHWALAKAFIEYAQPAGYEFDVELFDLEMPNPNPGVFNFGYVTGYECYPIDVVSLYVSYNYVFANLKEKDPERFVEYYTSESIRYDLAKYLKPLTSPNILEVSLVQVSY